MKNVCVMLLVAALCAPTAAFAQEAPPTGPAQIIKRAQQGRAQRDMQRATVPAEAAPAMPPGHPPVATKAAEPVPAQGALPPGHPPTNGAPAPGPVDQGSALPPGHPPMDGSAKAAQPAATAPITGDASDLPKGTIEVVVRGLNGSSYADGEVSLGVMESMGGRSEKRGKTNAEGRAQFRDLPVGSKQAYRINVMSGGAKFSSNPFRLSETSGYRVEIALRPTTRDDRLIFGLIGQAAVELKDDRLHVTQSMRLVNAGSEVFVLPTEGKLVELPKGFTAFQWQDVMTDQHAGEVAGKGFKLTGSLAPGNVTFTWAYDIELEGAEQRIPIAMPFRLYAFRVIAEAPEGLKLKVSGFPDPERIEDQGRELLFTQVQRQPPEPPVEPLTIRITGIPGPGPGRWIATLLAIFAVAIGLVRAFQKADDSADRKTQIAARKKILLDEARATDAEHKKGEIGPEFYARKMDEITTEIAMLLRDEEGLAKR